jgi:general secretion pathway protein G
MTGSRRGFTLIELLCVMAIIATLLTVAVPRYFKSLQRSREAVLQQDLTTMREAIDKFYGDTGKHPASLAVLVEKRYLRAIPIDPITRTNDKWALVPADEPDDTGVKDVHSGADGAGENGVAYAAW